MSATTAEQGDLTREYRASPADASEAAAGFRQLLRLIRPYWWLMGLTMFSGILNQACAIGGAALGAYLVGAAATGKESSDLLPLIGLLLVLVVGRGLATWAEMWFSHDLAYRILAEFRGWMYWALERLAPSYLIDRRSGDLASAAMADVEVLEWFYAHTIGTFVIAVVVPLAALGVLGWMNWLLPLVLLPFLLLAVSVPFWLARLAARQGRELRARVADLNAEVVDAVQGLREIAIFNQESAWTARIGRHTQDLTGVQIANGQRSGLERVAGNSLRALGMLAVLALAAELVARGELDGALFPVAVLLAFWVFEPVATITTVARDFGQLLAASNRVFAVLDAPALVTDRVDVSPRGPVEPVVRFEQVTFRYADRLPDALCDVSFSIAPGETVALVGESGAGKSTCSHLLLRFWDVTGGAITLGGHDLRDFRQEDLRAMIALVPQDIFLFNRSIRENIRLGRPEATDADVEAAARTALAHDFIMALPQGYATPAGERGVQMSGGQRQRLAIARAFLRDAPLLVMDEAVSNLDTENERALQAAMQRLRVGRTTLIIAHRLSTIRAADRIVVLDGGRVAEVGPHNELLRHDGIYSRLIATQEGGIIPARHAE